MEVWRHTLESAPRQGPCVLTLGNFDGVHAGHRTLLEHAAQRARALKRAGRGGHLRSPPRRDRGPGTPAQTAHDPAPAPGRLRGRGHGPGLDHPVQPRLLRTQPAGLPARAAAGASRPWNCTWGKRSASARTGPATWPRWKPGARPPAAGSRPRPARPGRRPPVLHPHPPGPGRAATWRRPPPCWGIPTPSPASWWKGSAGAATWAFPPPTWPGSRSSCPANGVYVTEVRGAHLPRPLRGLTNVGTQAHLPGPGPDGGDPPSRASTGDLYGCHLEVRFLHRLRGEQAVPGLEALQAQIAEDVAQGLAWTPGQASERPKENQ